MWKTKSVRLVVAGLLIISAFLGSGCGTNSPPVITTLTPSTTNVARGESCTISCVASDADDDTLIYEWSATSGAISGEGSKVTWTAPTVEGNYTITVTVNDGKGGTVNDSCTIQVVNNAPVITTLTPSNTNVARGESCTISCVASDADGDSLSYDWTATGGTITGEGSTISWIAPSAEGDYIIAVTVSDGKGGTASDSCTIPVANAPPQISSLNPSTTSVALEGSCTITCTASDADGDSLNYDWTATVGTITGEGSTITWIAPSAEGDYIIAVTVSDGKGGTVSDTCEITVEMKFGSIDIQSSPTGATIYLNGADTGNTTPYVIANLMTGTYTVKLVYYHYIDREETVTVAANETTYLNSSLTYASEKTLTIQPSATTGKDAGVDKFESTKNYGDHTALAAGAYGYTTNRSYLQFNLDSLPEGAVITSAALGLYYLYNEPGEPSEIGVYQVYQDWTEIGITWNSQPMFNIRPKCVLTLPTSPTNSFVHWDITELVRKWHDNLQYNFGVMLKSTDESVKEAWIGFYSSDWGDPIQRPKLVVTYFDSTP